MKYASLHVAKMNVGRLRALTEDLRADGPTDVAFGPVRLKDATFWQRRACTLSTAE